MEIHFFAYFKGGEVVLISLEDFFLSQARNKIIALLYPPPQKNKQKQKNKTPYPEAEK